MCCLDEFVRSPVRKSAPSSHITNKICTIQLLGMEPGVGGGGLLYEWDWDVACVCAQANRNAPQNV